MRNPKYVQTTAKDRFILVMLAAVFLIVGHLSYMEQRDFAHADNTNCQECHR